MQSAKINIKTYLPEQADGTQRNQKLKKACKDFESLLTYQLLRSMRKTVDKCDLFHGGQGEEIYQSLFDMQISKSMVGFGPNSLARLLYDQLKGQVSSVQGQEGDGTKAQGSLPSLERSKERVK